MLNLKNQHSRCLNHYNKSMLVSVEYHCLSTNNDIREPSSQSLVSIVSRDKSSLTLLSMIYLYCLFMFDSSRNI